VYFRSIMLYEFLKNVSAAQCLRNICEMFGNYSTSERTCQFWHEKLRSGDFDLIYKPRSCRPLTFNDEVLKLMSDENPRITIHEVGERFNVDHTTVLGHLRGLKMVSILDVCVPHKLSEKNLIDRFTACTSLLASQKEEPFLNRIFTGDEKWVLYDNQVQKRHWSVKGEKPLKTPKAGQTTKKGNAVLFLELPRPAVL
jgi:histone-lysine N-methyltransferase SETMAR